MITVEVVEANAAAEEADLRISDGRLAFLCFAHPWNPSMDGNISLYFLLGCRDIERCQVGDEIRTLSGYRHEIRGVVVRQGGREIKVGPFVFECDLPLPKDLLTGETVRLECERIGT
ncbi:MAG: hypothetical protein LBV36_03115 [Chromatiales bacterium]|jgi:hypothetical protein|nr:hypothetical protein [Chromatiales bacterium]